MIEGSDFGSNQSQAIAPTPQELHRQRRDRLRLYYSGGSFYGVPASYVSYILSTQLRFGELGDLLWLACVGVTDAYENSRLDMFGYARLAMEMKTHCVRIYPNDMYHQVKNTVFAEYLLGNQTETRSLTSTERKNLTEISLSESGRILSEEDFRFFLLRHSSLYDSMVYSNYVSTKLQLWSSKGMLRFQELLAKMGCPLEECRQPFPFMKPTLRRTLREKFEMYAEVSEHRG
jgi:cell division control protein 45